MDESKLRAHFREASTMPEGWSGDQFFMNAQGHKIRYGYAPALTDSPRGTIIHRHGHGESIDLYNEAMRWYQKLGFDVWAYDLCGHGLSEGKDPNHNPSPKDTFSAVHDLDLFVHNVVKRVPKKPLIMSAHSLSGHSGLIYMQRHPDIFSAAVMSSPMFDIYRLGMPSVCRPVIRALFQAACMLGFKNTATPVTGYTRLIDRLQRTSESLTSISLGEINYRDEVKNQIKRQHPERYHDLPSFGWVNAAFKTITPALKASFLRNIRTPLLIGSAGPLEDLVATDAHARVARIMPYAKLVKLPFAVHSLWHDREHSYQEWLKHVSAFLDRAAPPSPADPSSNEKRQKSAPSIAS